MNKANRARRTAPVAPAEVELNRFWDPTNPSSPHLRVLQRGGTVGIQFVPSTGLPEFYVVPAQFAVQLARASYEFAQELAAYEVKTRRLVYVSMAEEIEDLKYSLESKERMTKSTEIVIEQEASRADQYSAVLDNLLSGLTSIVCSPDQNLELFRDALQRLVESANEDERKIDSDGSQNEIQQKQNQSKEERERAQ